MSTAKDRLSAACKILADGNGPLRLRLHDAFVYHLMLVHRTELPEGCQELFDHVHSRMTCTASDRGSRDLVADSLMEMSDQEVEEVAEKIRTLHSILLGL
ncbi:hypothetical protein [Thiohalobacter thiocyanaticus]|uniref:Uncharacterized protein n=1 Tax=Thiohalobacter thiocyanaticus TaxID=585455 RepID=A0A426QMA5_9GAMM|nr:hypothetical protein [Thiohalobacter thiocyanaticus]RRQ22902.1 hypothetical protein D6C00_13850 [Thiohalobacter thiocyanaticus]